MQNTSNGPHHQKTGTEFESYDDIFNNLHVYTRNIMYNEMISKTGLCKTTIKNRGGWRPVSAASLHNTCIFSYETHTRKLTTTDS
jgi:hypothetical protein